MIKERLFSENTLFINDFQVCILIHFNTKDCINNTESCFIN